MEYWTKGKSNLKRGQHYLRYDLWYRELPALKSWQGVLARVARYLHLVTMGFREDRLKLHAATLTFSTLMSLLPLLAILLAIAKGLGQDQYAIDYLLAYTADFPEQFQELMQTILGVVTATDFGKLGAFGALTLLVLIIGVLSRMERSFNSVWDIAEHRGLLRRVTNYISIVIVVPILLLAAVTGTAQLKFGGAFFEGLGLLRLAPFFATWIAFSFLYAALPNTSVKVGPAVISGFLGSLLWQIWLRSYILIQPGVTNYNVVYGTLASVPIFLAWLQVSWFIILFGAQMTYAAQNIHNYQPELSKRRANMKTRILLGLAALEAMARSFDGKGPIFHYEAFHRKHAVNPDLLERVIKVLAQGQMVAEVKEETEQQTFVLARNPRLISVESVIDLFLEEGDAAGELGIHSLGPDLEKAVNRVYQQLESASVSLRDLLDPPGKYPEGR